MVAATILHSMPVCCAPSIPPRRPREGAPLALAVRRAWTRVKPHLREKESSVWREGSVERKGCKAMEGCVWREGCVDREQSV